ncbi:hypothetical protein GNF83_15985, partial [Clostridium perfringens]|nr:hypothetical protein [Clostridium perfringens]
MKLGKWRSIGVSTLAALLVMSVLLSACSGNTSTSSNNNANSNNAGESDKKPAPPEKNEKKPKITVSIYDRGLVPPGEGDYTKNRWTEWINENSPAEVEFIPVPRTGEAEKFNTLFASNSAPDLIMTYSQGYRNDLY